MLATLLVALVAIIQLAILVLEMFLWEGSAGRRAFNLSADFARQTRVLAANQGLYNGFLAAGLAPDLIHNLHFPPAFPRASRRSPTHQTKNNHRKTL